MRHLLYSFISLFFYMLLCESNFNIDPSDCNAHADTMVSYKTDKRGNGKSKAITISLSDKSSFKIWVAYREIKTTESKLKEFLFGRTPIRTCVSTSGVVRTVCSQSSGIRVANYHVSDVTEAALLSQCWDPHLPTTTTEAPTTTTTTTTEAPTTTAAKTDEADNGASQGRSGGDDAGTNSANETEADGDMTNPGTSNETTAADSNQTDSGQAVPAVSKENSNETVAETLNENSTETVSKENETTADGSNGTIISGETIGNVTIVNTNSNDPVSGSNITFPPTISEEHIMGLPSELSVYFLVIMSSGLALLFCMVYFVIRGSRDEEKKKKKCEKGKEREGKGIDVKRKSNDMTSSATSNTSK